MIYRTCLVTRLELKWKSLFTLARARISNYLKSFLIVRNDLQLLEMNSNQSKTVLIFLALRPLHTYESNVSILTELGSLLFKIYHSNFSLIDNPVTQFMQVQLRKLPISSLILSVTKLRLGFTILHFHGFTSHIKATLVLRRYFIIRGSGKGKTRGKYCYGEGANVFKTLQIYMKSKFGALRGETLLLLLLWEKGLKFIFGQISPPILLYQASFLYEFDLEKTPLF